MPVGGSEAQAAGVPGWVGEAWLHPPCQPLAPCLSPPLPTFLPCFGHARPVQDSGPLLMPSLCLRCLCPPLINSYSFFFGGFPSGKPWRRRPPSRVSCFLPRLPEPLTPGLSWVLLPPGKTTWASAAFCISLCTEPSPEPGTASAQGRLVDWMDGWQFPSPLQRHPLRKNITHWGSAWRRGL